MSLDGIRILLFVLTVLNLANVVKRAEISSNLVKSRQYYVVFRTLLLFLGHKMVNSNACLRVWHLR